MEHLVYVDNAGKKGERLIDKILNGTKTMIVRGAGGRKIPHGRVFEGETLYFMEKGTKDINLKAVVENVQNFEKLTSEETEKILSSNQKFLNLSDKQKERWFKKCLCLIKFKNLTKLENTLNFVHQSNMDDWLILSKIDDVLAGSDIKYNYDNSRF